MHLYSNNLSIKTTFSSLTRFEFLPAQFSSNNNFNLLQSSLGLDGKNNVETPEAIKAGTLSKLMRVLSLLPLRLFA